MVMVQGCSDLLLTSNDELDTVKRECGFTVNGSNCYILTEIIFIRAINMGVAFTKF